MLLDDYATMPSRMQSTARKLASGFEHELTYCSETGMLRGGSQLHATLRCVALLAKEGAEEVEELNSLIRIQSERVRNSTLDLLWSRVANKKMFCPVREHRVVSLASALLYFVYSGLDNMKGGGACHMQSTCQAMNFIRRQAQASFLDVQPSKLLIC